jgi:hypothetical protein
MKSSALTLLFTLALTAQPRVGRSNITVPLPSDVHELVTGAVQVPPPAERGADMVTLQKALQNSRLQNSGMSPFRIDVTFTSSGDASQTGQGAFSETWLSGGVWRWSATLGNSRVIRLMSPQGAFAESAGAVPMRIHMLRNAIFSSMYGNIAMGTQLRTASVTLNGKPTTCMMTSGVVAANYQGRLWEETEYCFDNASGLLVVSSLAPGMFTKYSYEKSLTLHGHTFPDHFTMYVGGNQVLDASLTVSDATGTDPNSLAPTPDLVGRGTVLDAPSRQPMSLPAPSGISKISPFLIEANIVDGQVMDIEVCAASDRSLIQAAIDAAKGLNFGPSQQQQLVYLNVKFVPSASN